MEHELVLQSDLDLLQALNCVDWPQSLAARLDVILELFADEIVDFRLCFYMERWRKRDEVLIHIWNALDFVSTGTSDIV